MKAQALTFAFVVQNSTKYLPRRSTKRRHDVHSLVALGSSSISRAVHFEPSGELSEIWFAISERGKLASSFSEVDITERGGDDVERWTASEIPRACQGQINPRAYKERI